MPSLFSTLSLQNITLQNRIVVSPMCQYSSIDGFANNWHLTHLGQFAIGKAGAIIQEATAVAPEGRISYADAGIWSDDHIAKLKEITQFITEQGSIAGIQLAHAGRKASTDKPWVGRHQLAPTHKDGWQAVAPSAIPFHREDHPPKALEVEEIQGLIYQFRLAARRAVEAGYQIIEIHAAHGYLIHQFLSPLVNERTDDYGGTFENRIRFLLDIIEAVKPELTGAQSLWVRISATDWAPNGWDVKQSVELVKILKEKGVEVIDVSSGGAVHHQQITIEPGYQVPFATQIKQETGICTGTVGLITSAAQAQTILDNDAADFILIGREFLRKPHLVHQWAKDLGVELPRVDQYARA